MKLGLKLSLMLSIFLVLIAIFAFGTLMIFGKMSSNIDTLNSASSEHRLVGELEGNLSVLLDAIDNWGLTGDERYRKEYGTSLKELQQNFRRAKDLGEAGGQIQEIGEGLAQVIKSSNKVMEDRHPVRNPDVLRELQVINAQGRDLIERIEELRSRSLDTVVAVAKAGEETKRNMVFYLFALISFSSLTALVLVIRIRRTIAEPFRELLTATERIGQGELSYRISMNRRDEFGTVSDRFNTMVSALEASNRKVSHKLAETELFLDVARTAATTLDLEDALSHITETIAAKLGYDCCSVYILRHESGSFSLEASSCGGAGGPASFLASGDGLVGEVVTSLRPVTAEDTESPSGGGAEWQGFYRSVMILPIIRDGACSGLLVAGKHSLHVFSEDESNTLMIAAHTIGSVARNAELYQSARKQLQELSVLYELSRAVTSVLDSEELLRGIAAETARLLSSRGCIIRLLENGTLKVKSYFGLPQGLGEKMELALGEGIAGWVAAKGEPLLAEDVSKMPAGMRVPLIDVKSVICVPLKVGGTVIGTLGLYDKYRAEDGAPLPYSFEDLKTAEGLALISAMAIDKSRIYENEVKREKEASEAKKRLDLLFNSVQGGIISLGGDYTIVSVNKYIEDWLGMPADELIGHSSVDIFHDKIGICPHCAAKATFETGEVNSIMQSRGVNYAELTAYPMRSEAGTVGEVVVFIQDITERVLYQEETLSLYREVIQTKEYLESIIDNSADAIVTTDVEGIITSWNEGAEKIFGFSESEAIGRFLPFVPDFLQDRERENIERIKKGEVLKDIETLRRKKDGSIIEVSLTLSPIKDAAGEVIGISGISRDISEKKNVEKELIRRNQELSRLFFISSAMRGTLELDRLLRMVLIAVTMSDGMGFNRAILFLVDEAKGVLKGAMGVGPASPEDAWRIWDELSLQKKTLDDIMQEVVLAPMTKDSFLDKLSLGIEIPLDSDTVLARAVKEKMSFNIDDVRQEQYADPILIQQLGTQAYAIVPLISRDRVIGIIWVDNYFNRKPITEEDMKFLASFSNHVASAIENARLFEKVKMAEQQLENIFESMSDMVYFNSKDYEILSINKAVSNKLGKPSSEIVGKKCYEVFHGLKEPYIKCPHHKTVETKKAFIEELDDPYMGGTFLTSSSPIFDLNGEFIGSVHVVRDITELKNLQEKLVMAEKMAALGEVAAKVAHEIRNPLVSVGGFAKRLEKKLDGNLQEYASIIVKEVERLEGILREILGFVKEVRLAREVVNLNDLIEEVVTLMASDMEERGISLLREFGPPSEVFVDPNRMKEAIMNIVSNAVQALTGSGMVSIRTCLRGEYASVEIRDNGRGIPEADRQFIFNPFFTTKASGTGLGLAITHKIVEEHGGTIEVESEIDRGSVFRVYIPLKEVRA